MAVEPAASVSRSAGRPDVIGTVRDVGTPTDAAGAAGAAGAGSAGSRLLAGLERGSVAAAIVRGADLVVEWANPAFLALLPLRAGSSTVAELGVPGLAARVDQVVASGSRVPEAGRVRTAGDEEREAALSLAPIPSAGPGPGDVLVLAVDVTAQARDQRSIQRRADEQQLLDTATVAMHDALDPAAELTALTHSLVPAFADACSAIMLDVPVRPGTHDGSPLRGTRVSFASSVELSVELSVEPREAAGLSWDAQAGPLHDAVRTGRPAMTTLGRDASDWSDTAGSVAWLRAADVVGVAAAPIRVDGLVVGLLTFAATSPRGPFERADLTVMDRIATRAGVAVGQGLSYQRQRQASLTLQRSMLTSAPVVPGLEVVTRYRPTVADDEVGGDWYDAFALPGGDLAVVIGDVAGHDLASAATMGQLRSMLRALAHDRAHDTTPGEILARLDQVACGLRVTDFTSIVLGRLRLGPSPALSWSNAGHPPPLLIDASGRTHLVEHAGGVGPVLGVLPDAVRPTSEMAVPPEATLLLYTDGLVERRGPDPDANVATLVEQAAASSDGSLVGLCDTLVARAPVEDDVALLAVRLRADAPAGAQVAGAQVAGAQVAGAS